jgi:predicted RNA-binding Zn-ribbon protein involved in translation (DUF1610 family)
MGLVMGTHWKRYLTCIGCGREIVAFAGHWMCPHCGADNKMRDTRGRETNIDDSSPAIPLTEGDRDAMIDAVWKLELTESHDEVMSCRLWAGDLGYN